MSGPARRPPASPPSPASGPPRASPPLPVLPSVPARGNPCLDNACSACCHEIEMLLTEDDLARLVALRPGEDFWFRADDGFLQLRTRDGPSAMPGAGRPCWFLSPEGRCTVHDWRPEGCRLYPAAWDEGLRAAALDEDYCPHTDGFLLPRATEDAVRRLADRLEAERRARLARPDGGGAGGAGGADWTGASGRHRT